ncbi:MAG: hypothetical protein J0H54_02230 [Rhizobiales bacterium]|nr:hypothetical protein [Hyphomicrobiales bacterium]
MREEARLIILRALSEQPNGRLSSSLLVEVLANYGISKERGWVHDELAWLADRDAVALTDAGTVKIAELTDRGQRHIDRLWVIEGVKRPSRPGG